MDITEGLNEPQRAAVSCLEGPMLIIAGAGSGKTRVLTMRIANLIQHGVKPYNILALTFTNKAANEMKERIANIVGPDVAANIDMGTFHSVCGRILRRYAASLNISNNFTIYDTTDSRNLIKNIVKELNFDDKTYKPAAVLSTISNAKNDLILPNVYAQNANLLNKDKAASRPHTVQIYTRYVEECRKANALDFDDLLLYTNILLRDNKEALAKLQDKYKFILVDEYQDTNHSQYVIVNRLAQAHKNLCIVGDDAQSIYSFRGARIENILNFQKDYPTAKIFKLEQNYRSTQNIVGAANKLIAHNQNQLHKDVFSNGDKGDKVEIHECDTDLDESKYVIDTILSKIKNDGKSPNDFAILYRTNAQSRSFEEELHRSAVPYKVYGGQAFYQRKEIKDVLAYLRLISNHEDIESLRRIINYPKRQIGDTTVDKLQQFAASEDQTLWSVISNPLLLAKTSLNNPTQKRVSNFVTLIETLTQQSATMSAYELTVETLSQSGILQELSASRNDSEGKERYDNVQELLNGIQDFTQTQTEQGEENDLQNYLQGVALITDLDAKEDGEMVRLMTIHTSKGLEFDTVFIVGVEDETFPGQQSAFDPLSLEEERRLMYVALTRAKRSVSVSYARQRFKFGKTEPTRPSRFIAELDPQICNNPTPRSRQNDFNIFSRPSSFGFAKKSPATKPINPFSATKRISTSFNPNPEPQIQQTPDGKFRIGARVEHERFGLGTVKEISGSNINDLKLKIAFDTQGEKTLLLKFARIHTI